MNRRAQETGFFSRYGRWLLGLGLTFLIVHDIFGAHGFLAMRRTQKEIEVLREKIEKLHAENGQLAEQVKALKSDPKLIERIARDELGLARPGEIIIKLPAPAKAQTPVL